MLTIFIIVYIIGVMYAISKGYSSYGEELCETYPKLNKEQKYIVTLFATVCSVFSWISFAYFAYRHKNFIS